MDNKYAIKIHCLVFGTNISLNKKYILSLNDKEIVLPNLYLTNDNISSIENSLIQYLRQYIFVNELELLPQLISLHSVYIDNVEDNTLNVIYGFVVNHTININNAYWYEFDFLEPTKYSNLLFEAIQKLK